jgi:hypothetical protein
MAVDPKNPLGMVADPYAGDSFMFPETLCTEQRRLWFRRANEISAFLMTTEFALKECKTKYEHIVLQKKFRPDTPFKIESSDGRSVVTPVKTFLEQFARDVDVLCRQVFLMYYGSLETYLFELLERSFPEIGKTENILGSSLEIMMGANWDGKFCKMRDIFSLNYKANDIKIHFSNFEMNFEGKIFKNPLLFMDELAKIRHKIVHASSILEKGKLIFINAEVFLAHYAFCVLLTDYIDTLFVKRFGYEQVKIHPGAA